MAHIQVNHILDGSYTSQSYTGWLIYKSIIYWMAHIQVNHILDGSYTSQSYTGWLIYKSIIYWMAHIQVNHILDGSYTSQSYDRNIDMCCNIKSYNFKLCSFKAFFSPGRSSGEGGGISKDWSKEVSNHARDLSFTHHFRSLIWSLISLSISVTIQCLHTHRRFGDKNICHSAQQYFCFFHVIISFFATKISYSHYPSF